LNIHTMTLDRITRNPEVMGGKFCVRGMRVTVGTIVGLVASGHLDTEILAAYPYLEEEDIRQALAYAAWRIEEIEVPPSSSMKLLIDMNLRPLWVEFLARSGFESPLVPCWPGVGARHRDHGLRYYTRVRPLNSWPGLRRAARDPKNPAAGRGPNPLAQDVLPAEIGEIILRARHASRSARSRRLGHVAPSRERIRLLPI
jgi:uncharacterized protein (DUF433 family)